MYWNTSVGQSSNSLTTDLSLLRSVTKGQSFTAIGQTIQFQHHFTPKETGYAWVSYYSPGNYKNDLTLVAKDPITTPIVLPYTVESKLRFRQVSLGWKHYFLGSATNENFLNLYGAAGFGLLVSKIENTYTTPVDTTLYYAPTTAIAGTADFRRLTFDLTVGSEFTLATGLYLYAEVKTWLPASSNPSPYLYNNNTPQVIILNGGLRILFDQ